MKRPAPENMIGARVEIVFSGESVLDYGLAALRGFVSTVLKGRTRSDLPYYVISLYEPPILAERERGTTASGEDLLGLKMALVRPFNFGHELEKLAMSPLADVMVVVWGICGTVPSRYPGSLRTVGHKDYLGYGNLRLLGR